MRRFLAIAMWLLTAAGAVTVVFGLQAAEAAAGEPSGTLDLLIFWAVASTRWPVRRSAC